MDKATLRRANYEEDFALWLEDQATLLRQRRFNELDIENLAEEVEDISKRDKREVRSRLTVLLAHLLKLQFQGEKRSRSWEGTIREQRRQLKLIFKDSPSLRKNFAPSVLEESYLDAREDASRETGLPIDAFPETCPYTLESTLEPTFLPEG